MNPDSVTNPALLCTGILYNDCCCLLINTGCVLLPKIAILWGCVFLTSVPHHLDCSPGPIAGPHPLIWHGPHHVCFYFSLSSSGLLSRSNSWSSPSDMPWSHHVYLYFSPYSSGLLSQSYGWSSPSDMPWSSSCILLFQSLIIWAAVPVLWLVLTLLVFLMYFCVRCCQRDVEKKQRVPCLRWTMAILALLTWWGNVHYYLILDIQVICPQQQLICSISICYCMCKDLQ